MESKATKYKEQWRDKHLAYISGFGNIPRKMADQVNDQVNSLQLSDNEKKVFFFIKEFDRVNKQNDRVNGQVINTLTIGHIAEQLGMSYSTIQRSLRTLKQKNMIQRVGSDKTGYWHIIES